MARHIVESAGMTDHERNEHSAVYVLTLSCPDRSGIVAAVSGLLAERGCNILESQQYGDRGTGRFFMRVQFTGPGHAKAAERAGVDELRGAIATLAGEFAF